MRRPAPRIPAWIGFSLSCLPGVPVAQAQSALLASRDDMPGVTVTAHQDPADVEDFPATTATVTQAEMNSRINSIDVEDAVKYLPSVFLRKRNYGDTQPVLATRNWGVNSSARTLVYVDDIPISALIANNNTVGAPRWGVVSPEQIARIDMLYGPYSSEYSGNSMGGVMRIVTRSPQSPEFTVRQTEAVQSFSLYGTDNHYVTSQTSATAGGSAGNFDGFVAANFQDSFSQPLSLVTAAVLPAGTNGGFVATNKLGQPANVLGAGGLLHTRMTNLVAKVSYNFASIWRATYLADFWHNDAQAHVSTYLKDGAGLPTFARASGFATNQFDLVESHVMQGISLASDTQSRWDGEVVLTHYDFLKDRQRSPAGVAGAAAAGGVAGAGTAFTTNGRLADLSGTQWRTIDLKGTWRPFGIDGRIDHGIAGAHELSFGAHADRYILNNPTYNTSAWQDDSTRGSLFSSGRGRTETQALWLQDRWTLRDDLELTAGARQEYWTAKDGFNFSGNLAVVQPPEHASGFSPKATLLWRPSPAWSITGSLARSIRFPTVGELYQLVSTGSTFSSPNADLAPERDVSGEIAIEHEVTAGSIRVSLFQENTRDALIAQTATLAAYPVPVSYVVNVGEIRNRGLEVAAQKGDSIFCGLDLEGSVTFVDSSILSNDAFASSDGTTSEGKHAPYVPRWRATLVASYRFTTRASVTLAGRYSGQMYSTVDNTDNTPHVYGAFDPFLVLDVRAHVDMTKHLSASLGVDNLTDRKYFLFHPFPQRTVVADLRARF